MCLGLRADESGRRPRGFEAETATLENGYLDAFRREAPRDRATDDAAADYERFHATRLPDAAESAKAAGFCCGNATRFEIDAIRGRRGSKFG